MRRGRIIGRQVEAARIGDVQVLAVEAQAPGTRRRGVGGMPDQTRPSRRSAGAGAIQQQLGPAAGPREVEPLRSASDLAAVGVPAHGDQLMRRQLGAEVTGQDPGLAPKMPDRLAVEPKLDGGHVAGDGELHRMDTDDQTQER